MGPFPSSFGNLYILLAVDYVSKWVEEITCPRNDASTVAGFLQRNILSRFGAPRTIISDGGSHFKNKFFCKTHEQIRNQTCNGIDLSSLVKWASKDFQYGDKENSGENNEYKQKSLLYKAR